MKVTVDANILFACLIKNGCTRRIWFNPELRLFAPKFIVVEFLKYGKTVERKSSGKEADFKKLLNLVLAQVELVPDSELKPYMPAAASLLKDPKDWLYLACALKEDTVVWSNDKEFKNQNRIKVKTTAEMEKTVGIL